MKKEYDPVTTLRDRDIDPELIYRDKEGKAVINDPDLHFILKFFRQNIIKGSLLNLGAGITHVHYMCALEDKLTHITALDISSKNNQLITEFLESSQNIGFQKTVKKIDLETLKILIRALKNDKSYGLKKEVEGILKSIYLKSLYKGKLDIITADMIEQMKDLGNGKLIDGRKYDNILLSHSIYYRDEEELYEFMRNVQKCLKPKGKIIIIDNTQYKNPKKDNDPSEFVLQEDEKVIKKYGQVPECESEWEVEEMNDVLKETGFKNIKISAREISPFSKDEKEIFEKYLCVTANK